MDVGDDARQLGMGALMWLASQLRTNQGRDNLHSTTASIAALVADGSELWEFAVSIGRALEPVVRGLHDEWRPGLSYEEKETMIRSAIAELVQGLAATFPITQISLP